MTRAELLSSRGYWIAKIQIDLFNQLENYMTENDLSRTQLAEKLGVTKGYVSQILNGDFDHKISKLVDLALAIGKVPHINYIDLAEWHSSEINNNSIRHPNTVFKEIIRVNQTQSFSYPETHLDEQQGKWRYESSIA